MLNVVLVNPEIPPNTGNVIRLCANTGAALHLVEPLGFSLDAAKLRRAGLDYHEYARVRVHASWEALLASEAPGRMFALTTGGRASPYETRFERGDWLVFGCETRGLPEALLAGFAPESRLRLPMRPGNRSLNLSNAVAVTVFEAWRQFGFEGAAPAPG
ncbi:tRNA (cytidine(34)-2'-O)-methyltransferase [Burkholderiaceae bacterium FT117]|uniref:tRNA (cytidine(34)-2'-O)-methyltransferase n=1 Tax=Zeimonas sediminis TaxID=2944268 RepID=UPI0023430CC4|nr:tRNA (cytidine(34)-2'-O)-methyltransferase [Zeimonas sediminis]MCM5571689.1 tRNA (cytidine(34)-2'-O)-methyltransferase [Zeimonas sediminis]